ncbi:hypothetical protein SESBI_27409 [Sesbania bispinosa]|nr:hypothetical protein SESBI_27409 [Sesbania bispinosa]
MSSSWAIFVLMFILATMTSIPATASTIEYCLRLELNPPPPSPPNAAPGIHSVLDLSRMFCRDVFRSVGHSIRITGTLPLSYVAALCNIFGDNEQKVEDYIREAFITYDFHKLMAGQSCATIRKKPHPPSLSSSSRL